ncbi:putative transmembrane protein [Leptothrix cholodnii SP-6]|uniref:Putative transmembrane protein n=1 Tax=Leptothrix cholodnii (strain ATCC 51168 / LMG 8142 / SP-6) TaxID=395495 RepID=B1Y228_LEPCP|nr:DUF4124 domain-containing protein [Leptothrix cholodnii]ACB34327.1 putative transmembrane protein [Leptothrix cholodnii SP-6]
MSTDRPLASTVPSAPVRARALHAAWLLCALCGVLISPPSQAQWKWRNAQGQVQYSDRPPPQNVPPRDILQRPAAARPPVGTAPAAAAAAGPASAASGPRTVDPELNARRRDAEAAERKAADEQLARERAESCARARDYLRTLETGLPIARVNAQGERTTLGDNERRAELNRAREVIAADCR